MIKVKALFLFLFMLLVFCGNSLAEGPAGKFSELVEKACQNLKEDKVSCDIETLRNGLKEISTKDLGSSHLEFLYSELGGDEYGLILAESYLREGNSCKARKALLKLNDLNIKVVHARGIFAYRGYCRESNHKEAYSLFHQASAGGNLDSYYYKGLMLYSGRGVEQNLIEAGRIFLWLAAFDHNKTTSLIEKLSTNGYLNKEEFNDLLKERARLVNTFKRKMELTFLIKFILKIFSIIMMEKTLGI